MTLTGIILRSPPTTRQFLLIRTKAVRNEKDALAFIGLLAHTYQLWDPPIVGTDANGPRGGHSLWWAEYSRGDRGQPRR